MIRLLIADDHPIVREGLQRIINECADMTVVAQAVDGDQVLEKLASHVVDVLLLDISMPGRKFLDILQELKGQPRSPQTLVLSMHPEEHYAIRALRAGASGYLTKDHSPEQLTGAIRRVYGGGKHVSQSLAERLVQELDPGSDRPPHTLLSDREYEVFAQLGGGKSVQQIADELALSPKTISTYRSRVLQKLNLTTNGDLIRYGLQNGLVD